MVEMVEMVERLRLVAEHPPHLPCDNCGNGGTTLDGGYLHPPPSQAEINLIIVGFLLGFVYAASPKNKLKSIQMSW